MDQIFDQIKEAEKLKDTGAEEEKKGHIMEESSSSEGSDSDPSCDELDVSTASFNDGLYIDKSQGSNSREHTKHLG